MTLIAILTALLVERILSYSALWRAHDLTGAWLAFVGRLTGGVENWTSSVRLVLVLAPPLIVLQLLLWWLTPVSGPLGVFGPVIVFVGSVVMLLMCLGPRDLGEELHSYVAARRRGDDDEAEAMLDDLMAGPGRTRSSRHDGRSPLAAAFVQGHERWFGVLLWFFAFGVVGAVAYRMAASLPVHLRDTAVAPHLVRWADRYQGVLAWVPARITALAYTLAGSSNHALSRWREFRQEFDGDWMRDSWALLANVGVASMADDADGVENRDDCLLIALALLDRSLLILLAVLSLLTLGGWLS